HGGIIIITRILSFISGRLATKSNQINLLFSFFFQAEDGIRDFHVTGVQTCALPIYGAGPQRGDVGAGVGFAHADAPHVGAGQDRSEERRVGKECRSRRARSHEKSKGKAAARYYRDNFCFLEVYFIVCITTSSTVLVS